MLYHIRSDRLLQPSIPKHVSISESLLLSAICFPDEDTYTGCLITQPIDPRIDQFVSALRVNPNTYPEVGATCSVPVTSFDPNNPPPFDPTTPDPSSPTTLPER